MHAHGLRTYAVSPHIEILIRGNCESLFPSCVPRIRYDATPRTSCHRDFLSRQRVIQKDLRDYAYIYIYFSPIFLLVQGEENSMGIWATRARVIGFLAARNSMTLFIPYSSNLPTCHPPSAGQTMRIRWRNFRPNIRCGPAFNRGEISSLIFLFLTNIYALRVFNLSSRLGRFNKKISLVLDELNKKELIFVAFLWRWCERGSERETRVGLASVSTLLEKEKERNNRELFIEISSRIVYTRLILESGLISGRIASTAANVSLSNECVAKVLISVFSNIRNEMSTRWSLTKR